MANTLEELTREAIQLPRQQRLALASFLLELDEAGEDPAAETAWEEEIQARIQAIDNRTAVGVPYEDVLREACKRLVP